MLLTIVTISGTLFIAAAVSGLLIRYQFRQAADTKNSSKAIYAADSGLGLGYYLLSSDAALPMECKRDVEELGGNNKPYVECTYEDGTTVKVTCISTDIFGGVSAVACDSANAESVRKITAVGKSGKVVRIFEFSLD